jgi:mRNA-degrading endonuclease RelE of RelBE toxin-antitoxin system
MSILQIVFNDVSAAELSQLPCKVQFDIIEALNITPLDVEEKQLEKRFGVLKRQGHVFYRCRAGEFRIYFGIVDGNIVIHRVLHKNTLADFLYRSNLPGGGEDEQLSESNPFWNLIDEGAKTLKTF